MSKNELQKLWDLPSELPYRERVEELQKIVSNINGAEAREDDKEVLYPSWTKYNHYFSDGLYVREMFCPKGYLAFTVIHNTANPLFMMKGTMAISSEDGVQELVAPTFVLTKPGTKRICYFLEDTVCVTVHPNPDGLTDLDEVERKMFSGDWERYDETLKQDVWEMMEHENYFKKIENKKTIMKNKKN